MAQILFNHIVSTKLPFAVPSQLDNIDNLGLGQVFVFSKRPQRFRPFHNNDLKFTNSSIPSLLEESSIKNFEIISSTNLEFDTSKGGPLQSKVDLRASGPVSKAVADLELNVEGATDATISADLGMVKNLEANVLYSCSKNLQVKLDHPTVREVIATGGTLFAVTTVYRADRCHIKVSVGDTQKDVLSRDSQTIVAFLLVKLVIDGRGILRPKINNGCLSVLERHTSPILLSSAPADTSAKDTQYVDPAKIVDEKLQNQASLDASDWVVVDLFKADKIPESVLEEPEGQSNSVPSDSGASQVRVEEGQSKVVEEIAQVMEATTLSRMPDSGDDDIEIPMNPQLDQRFVYSLKDFQPFESITYDGIYMEVNQWVKPLLGNEKLHSTFLSYVTPPHTSEKLKKLSQFFQGYGKALRDKKPTPVNSHPPLEPLRAALSVEWGPQLGEVSSLIIVSEALVDFPQHIVKKAIELSSDKRSTLIDFIRSTPYGGDKHVYIDEGPFGDPDLNPFMTRMGFSIPMHTKNLVLDLSHEENEDRLAAGMILLVSTHPPGK